jgi:hypothetical protein
MKSLRYKGSQIQLETLRSWLRQLLVEANNLMCRELVFRPTTYLDTRDPSLFHDQLTWCTNGSSFVDLAENKLQDGQRRVLGWAQESAKGRRLLSPPDSKRVFHDSGG